MQVNLDKPNIQDEAITITENPKVSRIRVLGRKVINNLVSSCRHIKSSVKKTDENEASIATSSVASAVLIEPAISPNLSPLLAAAEIDDVPPFTQEQVEEIYNEVHPTGNSKLNKMKIEENYLKARCIIIVWYKLALDSNNIELLPRGVKSVYDDVIGNNDDRRINYKDRKVDLDFSAIEKNFSEWFESNSTVLKNWSGCLNLHNLHLSYLPNEIFSLSNLSELVLSDNNFSNLPKEIRYLKKLKSLILCDNYFYEIPVYSLLSLPWLTLRVDHDLIFTYFLDIRNGKSVMVRDVTFYPRLIKDYELEFEEFLKDFINKLLLCPGMINVWIEAGYLPNEVTIKLLEHYSSNKDEKIFNLRIIKNLMAIVTLPDEWDNKFIDYYIKKAFDELDVNSLNKFKEKYPQNLAKKIKDTDLLNFYLSKKLLINCADRYRFAISLNEDLVQFINILVDCQIITENFLYSIHKYFSVDNSYYPASFFTFLNRLVEEERNFGVLDYERGGVVPKTLVHHFFFSEVSYKKLFHHWSLRLISLGASLSPAMIYKMKLKCRTTGDNLYRKLLLARNLASPLELNPPKLDESRDLYNRLSEGDEYLSKALTICNLNPSFVDMREIQKIKLLKKEFKSLPQHSLTPEIQILYTHLSEKYDTFIEKHIFLSELSYISKEFREEGKKPIAEQIRSRRAKKFFALWRVEETESSKAETKAALSFLYTNEGRLAWFDLYMRATNAYQNYASKFSLNERNFTFNHGTTVHSLPGITMSGSLVPAGMAMKEGLPIFSGELCGSHTGINAEHLSGEKFTHSFDDGKKMYLASSTRLLVNFKYASSKKGYKEMWFNIEESWNRLTVRSLNNLIYPFPFINPLDVDVIRVRQLDPMADSKLREFKIELEKLITQYPDNEEFSKIHKSLIRPISKINADLLDILNREPYPIIFASTTQISKISSTSTSKTIVEFQKEREFFVQGKQELGKDIQFAFTQADKVAELQEIMRPFNVEVFEFEAAYLLETNNMIVGSRILDVEAQNLNTQANIGLTLQRDFLSKYAKPFPENPTYMGIDKVSRVKISIPNYGHSGISHAEYIEKIKAADILPRSVHGAMHATRTAIWSQLFANLLERGGQEAPTDRYTLALAAAAHDSARQDDNKDFWDYESSLFFKSYLVARNFVFDNIEGWAKAISHKDPEDGVFTCPIQKVIHDADCLEIMRCLYSIREFRKERLSIFKDVDPALLDCIITEAWDFIKETEKDEVKFYLEQNSSNYYKEVISKITKEKYPTLYQLLEKEILDNV